MSAPFAGRQHNPRVEAQVLLAVDSARALLQLALDDAKELQEWIEIVPAGAMMQSAIVTSPRTGVSYSLTNCTDKVGCCTCSEGVQNMTCKHHVVVLRFLLLGSAPTDKELSAFYNQVISSLGTHFGMPDCCQFGPGGLAPLLLALGGGTLLPTGTTAAHPSPACQINDLLAAPLPLSATDADPHHMGGRHACEHAVAQLRDPTQQFHEAAAPHAQALQYLHHAACDLQLGYMGTAGMELPASDLQHHQPDIMRPHNLQSWNGASGLQHVLRAAPAAQLPHCNAQRDDPFGLRVSNFHDGVYGLQPSLLGAACSQVPYRDIQHCEPNMLHAYGLPDSFSRASAAQSHPSAHHSTDGQQSSRTYACNNAAYQLPGEHDPARLQAPSQHYGLDGAEGSQHTLLGAAALQLPAPNTQDHYPTFSQSRSRHSSAEGHHSLQYSFLGAAARQLPTPGELYYNSTISHAHSQAGNCEGHSSLPHTIHAATNACQPPHSAPHNSDVLFPGSVRAPIPAHSVALRALGANTYAQKPGSDLTPSKQWLLSSPGTAARLLGLDGLQEATLGVDSPQRRAVFASAKAGVRQQTGVAKRYRDEPSEFAAAAAADTPRLAASSYNQQPGRALGAAERSRVRTKSVQKHAAPRPLQAAPVVLQITSAAQALTDRTQPRDLPGRLARKTRNLPATSTTAAAQDHDAAPAAVADVVGLQVGPAVTPAVRAADVASAARVAPVPSQVHGVQRHAEAINKRKPQSTGQKLDTVQASLSQLTDTNRSLTQQAQEFFANRMP